MKKRILSLLLMIALIVTLSPQLPGVWETAHAAPATVITLTPSEGDQIVLSNENASGGTYSYDAETQTLTLNNWSGKSIVANGDFDLHLAGTNTITMDGGTVVDWNVVGLSTGSQSNKVNISADSEATLNISANGLSTDNNVVYGIFGDCHLKSDVNLNINMTDVTSSSHLYGCYKLWYEGSNNTVNMNITGTTYHLYGCSELGVKGSALTGNKAEITVKNTAESESRESYGIGALYVDNGGFDLTVSADNNNGDQDKRTALIITNLKALTGTKLTVTKGITQVISNIIPYLNNSVVSTTPAKDNYWWKKIDGSHYAMADDSGDLLDRVTLVYNSTHNAPKWTAGTHISIPEMKVGDSWSGLDLRAGVRGLVDYNKKLSFEIVKNAGAGYSNTLPAGLVFGNSDGRIYGTPKAPCAAGKVKIRCTDNGNTTGSNSVEFTLNYGKVVEPDKYMTVNGTRFEMKGNAGNQYSSGWSYNGSTQTLTLRNYNGGPITAEKGFNLHLIGANTITMNAGTVVNGNVVGLSTGGGGYDNEVNISADSGATLNIKANNFDAATYNVYGIHGRCCLNGNVNLNIDMKAVNAGDYMYGCTCLIYKGSNNTATVKVEGSAGDLRGISNLYARKRDCEDMSRNSANITVKNTSTTASNPTSTGVSGLNLEESTLDLTVSADNNGGTKDKRTALGIASLKALTGTKLTVTKGTTQVISNIIPYLNNSVVSTKPADDDYWWKNIDGSRYAMADANGDLLDSVTLEYNSAHKAPKWTAGTHISIPEMKVGDSWSGLDLRAGVRGLVDYKNNLKFEIVQNAGAVYSKTLPAGLVFGNSDGWISGTPKAPCAAGTVKIRCTDNGNTNTNTTGSHSVEFDLHYGKVSSRTPVTGLTLSDSEWTATVGDTKIITATVTPNDASYPNIEVTSSADSIVRVNIVSEPTNGATNIKLTALKAGSATITVQSKESGVKQEITVVVKHPTSTAQIDFINEKLTNLGYNTTYKITVDGSTVEYTSDNQGRLEISEAWIGKTISIVRKGETEAHDSDAQNLAIPPRPEAPGVTAENESYFGAGNGKICGIDNTMQYRNKIGDEWSWHYCSGNVEGGKMSVNLGEYNVRVMATGTQFKSSIATVIVGTKPFTFEKPEDIPSGNTTASIDRIYLSSCAGGGHKPYSFSKVSGPDWIRIENQTNHGYVITGRRPTTETLSGEIVPDLVIKATDKDGTELTQTIKVGKITSLKPETPGRPELNGTSEEAVETNSITIKTNTGMKYLCGKSADWTDNSPTFSSPEWIPADDSGSYTFTGLQHKTEYKIFALKLASGEYGNSEASEPLVVTTKEAFVSAPVPSKASGGFKDPFPLTATTEDGATIRYTISTNGTPAEPTDSSLALPTGGLTISEASDAIGTVYTVKLKAFMDDGSETKSPSETVTLTYTKTNGVTVSGSVVSYGDTTEGITIELIPTGGGTPISATIYGNNAVYSLAAVPDGEYTLRVDKNRHAMLSETITVGNEDVTDKNISIYLWGDVNGDGTVTAADAQEIQRYAAGLSSVFDTASNPTYRRFCADVTGDGTVTAADAQEIQRYAAGLSSAINTLS